VLPEDQFAQCTFQRSLVVSDTSFEKFLLVLKSNFSVIPLSDLLEENRKFKNVSERPQAIITFDDGWIDNYEVALPLIEKHQIPATIFLSTDYIGANKGFWWQTMGELLSLGLSCKETNKAIAETFTAHLGNQYNLPADEYEIEQFIENLKSDNYEKIDPLLHDLYSNLSYTPPNLCLTWKQCLAMSKKGIEFGSHTCSHPRLSLLSTELQQQELINSKQTLTQKSVNYVDALCYPYGDFNDASQRLAAQNYSMALSTHSGIVRNPGLNRFGLHRIHVSDELAKNPNRLHYRIARDWYNA
jgi:peptidoglycan/xylan/chitin deacetylase (PgdA/CDA1 family)